MNHLESEKLRAEISNLEAERDKTKRDNSTRWRIIQLSIPAASILIAAVGLYFTLLDNGRKAAIEELAKNRTRQDSVYVTFDRWQLPYYPAPTVAVAYGQLPDCPKDADISRIQREKKYICPKFGDKEKNGYLCQHLGNHPVLQKDVAYLRFICWQPYGPEIVFSQSPPHEISVIASISTLDFNTTRDSQNPQAPVGNPRLKIEIPNQGITETAFVMYIETWSDSQPWDIGVSWSATGHLK